VRFILFWAVPVSLLPACLSGSAAKEPQFISELYQRAVYNGLPQPVEARFTVDISPALVYFNSMEDLEQNRGGFPRAPSDSGLYYVRVENPSALNDEAEIIIEYFIDRAPITIIAEEKQEALYNGDPKRIKAEADAPVQLSTSYFLNPEARSAASLPDTQAEQRSAALRGYKRVERPPIEPGTYYVNVYYDGDKNYAPALKEIEFTIVPKVK
jgi:hypothetical protein